LTVAIKKRGGEYSRTYALSGGLAVGDAAGNDKESFTHLLNMYRNYAGDPRSVVTFPGYRRLYRFGGAVHGIYSFPYGNEAGVVVYAGDALYRFPYRERDSLSELSPIKTGLSGERGTAFVLGGYLYLLDGKGFYRISAEGEVSSPLDAPYIPTVALNGEPYEQRNIVTALVRERRHIGDAAAYETTASGLVFMRNADGASATLVDYTGEDTYLTIPSTVTVAGIELSVTAIGNDAFSYSKLRGVTLPDTLKTIGDTAFRHCESLRAVVFPTALSEIGDLAFYGCTALSYVYIGAGMSRFGAAPFASCPSLREIGYALTEERLRECDESTAVGYDPPSFSDTLMQATVSYEAFPRVFLKGGAYRIPMKSEMVSYQSVTLDGREILHRGTPFVLPDAEELLDHEAIRSVLLETRFPLLSFSPDARGFTVNGPADATGEVLLFSTELKKGVYCLSGTPKGARGFGLSLTVLEKSGEKTAFLDTGDGVFFTAEEDGCSVSLSFFCEEGTQFVSERFRPSLALAEGSVSLETSFSPDGQCMTAIILSASDERLIAGKTLSVLGTASEKAGRFYTETGLPLNRKTVTDCTLSAVYDGRVFLSGNKDNPAAVLYPARTAEGNIDLSYFGEYNYFIDGKSEAANAALVATAGGLFVLKGELDGVGSVYCHAGLDTGEDLVPRVYPVTASLDGEAVTGASASFMGEAVFLSRRGLCAVGRESLEKERRLYDLSARVGSLLSKIDGKKSAMAAAGGYLVISDGEGVCYLVDGRSRDGRGYAFYPLSPVGSYTGDTEAYEYAASLPDGLSGYRLSATPRALYFGEVKSENGVFYTVENGVRILLTKRGERAGGVFSPARVLSSVEDGLLFGTEDGTLSLFNTDLCEEGGRFPPEAYGFAGHRYRSALSLPPDDLGVLHYRKKTVPHTAVLKTRDFKSGGLHILVRKDNEPFFETDCLFGGEADFGETDFTAFSFGKDTETVFPFRENLSQYNEKQYYLYTEDYRARFGLSALSFRFKIGGNIRK